MRTRESHCVTCCKCGGKSPRDRQLSEAEESATLDGWQSIMATWADVLAGRITWCCPACWAAAGEEEACEGRGIPTGGGS